MRLSFLARMKGFAVFLSSQEHMVTSVRWKKQKQGLIQDPTGCNSCLSASSFLLQRVKGRLAGR